MTTHPDAHLSSQPRLTIRSGPPHFPLHEDGGPPFSRTRSCLLRRHVQPCTTDAAVHGWCGRALPPLDLEVTPTKTSPDAPPQLRLHTAGVGAHSTSSDPEVTSTQAHVDVHHSLRLQSLERLKQPADRRRPPRRPVRPRTTTATAHGRRGRALHFLRPGHGLTEPTRGAPSMATATLPCLLRHCTAAGGAALLLSTHVQRAPWLGASLVF